MTNGSRSVRTRWVLAAAILGAGALALPVPEGRAQRVMPGAEGAAKDPMQGVSVRDSALALEKFAHGQRMESAGQWNTAADLYNEVLAKYSDRVVPASYRNEKGHLYQYKSVRWSIVERLARWPDEGLAVYKGKYESVAKTVVAAAPQDDLQALSRVFNDYFVTDTGKEAGLRLIDLAMERGEFADAAWRAEYMLDWHPAVVAERPRLLTRAGMALHLSGNTERARTRLKELEKKHADATVMIAGRDVIATSALAEVLATKVSTVAVASGDACPMPGGDESRGKIPMAAGKPGAPLYSVAYQPRPVVRGGNVNAAMLKQMDQQDQQTGATLCVVPSVDRGELFFQDGVRIYARNVEGGSPPPGWAETYGNSGAYTSKGGHYLPRGQQLSVTVTETSVLAVMGRPDRMALMQGLVAWQPGGQAVVCLDRVTGKERWSVMPRNFPEEFRSARELVLGGSPLVVGDLVFMAARGSKGQSEDAYVVALELATGKPRWVCYVASTTNPMAQFGQQGLVGDNFSHIAYSAGRLFVQTNVGAVAAVDAYSGTIGWLNIYPRTVAALAMNGNPFQQGMGANPASGQKPWTANPVIVQDGKVFVLPDDGSCIMVYNSGTGEELKRILLKDLSDADTLLGVVGENLVVAGEANVYSLSWKAYEAKTFTVDKLNWFTSAFNGSIRGRGFVVMDADGGSVWVPTTRRLARVLLPSGKLSPSWNDQFPSKDRTWSDGFGPGNMVVTGDHVVVATATRVDVYTDIDAARRRLDARIAEAPADPEPRLRYAEVMFTAGNMQAGLEKMDEAIGLLGGIETMKRGPGRDRVFSVAMAFAAKLSLDAKSAEQAEPLFQRASKSADWDAQKVHFRLERAKTVRLAKDWEGFVQLNQEILSDAGMRKVSVSEDGSPGPRQASEVAERAIKTAMERAGREIYAAVETTAANELTTAETAGDATRLLAVAEKYPNSAVATRAMLLAADRFESAGDARGAVRTLSRLYFKYPESKDRAKILEGMARNYVLLKDGMGVAAGRLAQAAKLPNNPKLTREIRLPGGQLIAAGTPMAEARATLTKLDNRARAALPDMNLPAIPPSSERQGKLPPPSFTDTPIVLEKVGSLAVPIREAARNDRVVAWTEGTGVAVYDAATAKVLARAAFGEAAPGSAWTGDSVVVWGTKELALVSADGTAGWSMKLDALPAADAIANQNGDGGAASSADEPALTPVNTPMGVRRGIIVRNGVMIAANGAPVQLATTAEPPGEGERIMHVRPAGDRVVVGTTSGRVFAIDLSTGKLSWQTKLSSRAIDRLVATSDFTAVRIIEEGQGYLVALDTFGGEQKWRQNFEVGSNAFPLNLALTQDGMLLYPTADRICGKDLHEPGDPLAYGAQPSFPNMLPFVGCQLPEQFVVADGRILVVTDMGQFVRVFSAETGRPLTLDGQTQPLATGSSQPGNTAVAPVTLRVAGEYVYAVGPRSLQTYNLERAGDNWRLGAQVTVLPKDSSIRDVIVTKDYVMRLDESTSRGPGSLSMTGHSRIKTQDEGGTPKESGGAWLTHRINEPSALTGWQAVDGGFVFHTADGKLKFLKGNRQN